MVKASQKNYKVLNALVTVAPDCTYEDAKTLRRAAIAIHTWSEHECNGLIQRDEKTGKPFYYRESRYVSANDPRCFSPAPDREAGAIKRIAEVCKRLGLHYYIQGDPRGGTLYVDNKPIPDNNYNRAVFIA